MLRTIALVAALAAIAPLSAQDINSTNTIAGDFAMIGLQSEVLNSSLRTGGAGRARPRVAGRSSSPIASAFTRGPSSTARLSYASTPALQRQAKAAFLQRLRARNPAAAQQLGAELNKHDVNRIYLDLVRSYGLRGDDAADAVAAYTLLGWVIVHNSDVPASVARTVRNRIAPALAVSPAIARQRAALGEEMKILVVTLHAGFQAAQRENTVPAFTAGVVRLFRQQAGVDIRSARFSG